MKRAGLAVVAAVLSTALAACNSATPSTPPQTPHGQQPDSVVNAVGASQTYIKQADLQSCPTTTETTAVSGGLPNILLPCLGNGPSVNLSDLRGKPMVVNFWAQWCGPCGRESPMLSAVAREEPGVQFLGVDTKETSVNAALSFDAHVVPAIHYPSVVDVPGQALTDVRFDQLPDTLLVSASGKVVYAMAGELTSAAQLKTDIAKYLGVKS